MKVFYSASSFLKDFTVARKIYDLLEQYGYQHTFDFVKKVDVTSHAKSQNVEYWAQLYEAGMSGIAKADIVILEVTAMSTGIGQLLQESVRKEKPLILLAQRSHAVRGLINGTQIKEKRVQILDYDMSDIEEVLSYALDVAKTLLTVRFTMLMSPEYIKHLDEMYELEGLSRSEYIRNLIREDMKKKMKK